MSIEIIFCPEAASRDALKDLLHELGFSPASSIWNWPKGTLTYHWYDETDYRSYVGVEVSIFHHQTKKNWN